MFSYFKREESRYNYNPVKVKPKLNSIHPDHTAQCLASRFTLHLLAPKGLGHPTSSGLPSAAYTAFVVGSCLQCTPNAILDSCPTVLPSPVSWGIHQNWGCTFIHTLSWSLHMPFNPATRGQAPPTPCDLLNLASLMPTKPVSHGKLTHCQVPDNSLRVCLGPLGPQILCADMEKIRARIFQLNHTDFLAITAGFWH